MITEKDIKEAQAGNSAAFTKIYNETVKTAYYVAKSLLGDDDATEDVLQESYIAVYNHLGEYKYGNFQGWVDTIVANRAKNYLRKKNPVLFTYMETEENPVVEFEDEKTEFRPEEQVDYDETRRLVRESVDSLSSEQRFATILFYFEDRSIKEIAEICECSENTIKSRLNYARKKIKEDVLALEKRGTKLYSVSAIPFLMWLLSEDAKACVVSETTKTAIFSQIKLGTSGLVGHAAEALAQEAGKSLTKEVGTEAVKVVTKEVATEAVKVAAGSAVKGTVAKAGMALGTKIAIAITAATVTVGAVAGGVALVQNMEESYEYEDERTDMGSSTESENQEMLSEEIGDSEVSSEMAEVVDSETSSETEEPEEEEIVASGVLSEGAIEWKIVGTTLYVTGKGAIPDFERSGKWYTNVGDMFPDEKPVAWQMYYELVDEIIVSEGITRFGKNNFSYFGKVTSFAFPSTLESLGIESMMWMGITSLEFPERLTTIERGALQGLQNITSVVIPGRIKKIPDSCFTGCDGLTEIIIEEGVESIGKNAFGMAESYDLEGNKEGGSHGYSIYIPDSVTFIDEDAIFAFGFEDSMARVHANTGSCAEQWVKTCGVGGVTFVPND